jgi:MSHA biogenesis protein MshJ
MQKQWQAYSDKFLTTSPREQYMVLIAGIVVFFMVLFNFFLEPNLVALKKQKTQVNQLKSENKANQQSIVMFEQSLAIDPNLSIKKQLAQYEQKQLAVDADLLKLTSELIDPVQMRHALIDLLKLEKGVKLVSFEVLPVKPLLLVETNDSREGTANSAELSTNIVSTVASASDSLVQKEQDSLGLYRHSIKLKLKGRYFNLRNYLLKLEAMEWTFFWQQFQYQLLQYPNSELEIEIYSLSTKQEFIGV